MAEAFISGLDAVCSLGLSLHESFKQCLQGNTGFSSTNLIDGTTYTDLSLGAISREKFAVHALQYLPHNNDLTFFEQLIVCSIQQANREVNVDLTNKRSVVIITSTKGNINLIHHKTHPYERERVHLWRSAEVVQRFLKLPNKPIVISNACISGISGLIWGKRLIEAGHYDNVIVTGADMLSRFVIEGFLSFKALSNSNCKPYDSGRTGLSLGEGAATIILSNTQNHFSIKLVKGAISNDANHISGPSRTGEGLYRAIQKSITDNPIDYISAHGTATPYNDEMESIAIERCGLQHIPMNSLKGYFGHTLGAAGVLETAFAILSMIDDTILKSMGYKENGVSGKINPTTNNIQKNLKTVLKIGAGFGGCNAALLLQKC